MQELPLPAFTCPYLLPAQAASMNDNYLKAPFPADYMQISDIMRVIEGAKHSAAAAAATTAGSAGEAAEFASVEAEELSRIQEEEEQLSAEASTAGNRELQRFISANRPEAK